MKKHKDEDEDEDEQNPAERSTTLNCTTLNMKLYIIVNLVFMLVGFGWGLNCNKPCGPCILPTCNYDGKCYYEGVSACGLENEKCRRKQNKLPEFIKSDSGYCDEGVKMCK
ncbi:uncharacterized protein LOC108043999 [Drosophila rhopaloa]|uniref:Uncharacterized protein n=3 Tax=Drosophila rhopaloa TaxID=1041015 RepID=A0ABM5JC45_DRORH|nr:uncharacterized protein LOC108043999 [Drosophila rhopaloa]